MSGDINIPEDLGKLIREIYVREFRAYTGSSDYGDRPIPRWDGGQSRSGRRNTPEWPKLAAFFVENNIDPERMIQLVFQTWKQSDPPRPDQLRGAYALSLYKEKATNLVEQLKVRFDSEYTQLEAHIGLITKEHLAKGHGDEAIVREALTDHLSVEVSNIFRYCIAKAAKLDDVAAIYVNAALREYLFRRRAYDTAWGVSIPEELRQAADAAISRTQH